MLDESPWDLTKQERRTIPAMVYVDLVESIEHYRELLQRAKRRGRLDYVAWITRNLLELRVWAEYCGKSTENAYDFYCDAVRDLVDMLRKFGDPSPELEVQLQKAKAFIGDLKPHHKFKHVDRVAEELGIEDFYEKNWKVLSKYVHPTAMSIFARFRGKAEARARKEFFNLGKEIGNDALRLLKESPTGEVYRKYRSTMNKVNAEMPEDNRPFPKHV